MNSVRFFIISSIVLLANICQAQIVNETEARKTGTDFLNKKKKTKVSANKILQTPQATATFDLAYTAAKDGKVCFYVYNCSTGGYVLVSADERSVEPILGYSTTGHFDYPSLPDNVREWIDSYADQIQALDSITYATGIIDSKQYRKTKQYSGKSVEPLLGETAWNQWEPYNNMCPTIEGMRTPTGCVATATAQIMYYHKWPVSGQGIVKGFREYDDGDIDLSQSTYQWDFMTTAYDDNSSRESEEAVALLMRDIGYAIEANYGLGETSAKLANAASSLIRNFDYDMGMAYRMRKYHTDEEWDSMIFQELDAGRPCLYSGGNHAFVCDGYEEDGFFHFNFGWGGEDNGYFLSSSVLNFSSNQELIIGIKKNEGGEPHIDLFTSDYLRHKNTESLIPVEVSSFPANSRCFALGNNITHRITSIDVFILESKSNDIIYHNKVYPIDNNEISYDIVGEFVIVSPDVKALLNDGDYYAFIGVKDNATGEIVKFHYPDGIDSYVHVGVQNGEISCKYIPEYAPPAEGIILHDGFYYKLDELDKEAAVTNRAGDSHNPKPSYSGNNLTIPDYINYKEQRYEVTGIDDMAFSQCNVDTLTIPKTVKSIGVSAFETAYIEKFIFEKESELLEIKERAFMDNVVLRDIVLPDGLKDIGSQAFSHCPELNSISIPASVENLGESVFDLKWMSEINVFWQLPKDFSNSFLWDTNNVILMIPEGTKSSYEALETWQKFELMEGGWSEKVKIGNFWYSLNHLSKIAQVEAPVDDSTYDGDIVLPETILVGNDTYTIDRIKSRSFQYSNMESLEIPKTVKYIGKLSFASCDNLSKVSFAKESTLKEIGDQAFFGNKHISEIELPMELKFLGEKAFYGTKLTSIKVPSSVIDIRNCAFPTDNLDFTDVFVEWNMPPVGMYVFCSISDADHLTLHVPYGTKNYYTQIKPWLYFSKIVEDVDLSVQTIEREGSAFKEDLWNIYNLQGVLLKANSVRSAINLLPSGIYILSNGISIEKVAVGKRPTE